MRSVQDSVLPRVQGCEPLPEGCGGEASPHISSFLFAALYRGETTNLRLCRPLTVPWRKTSFYLLM